MVYIFFPVNRYRRREVWGLELIRVPPSLLRLVVFFILNQVNYGIVFLRNFEKTDISVSSAGFDQFRIRMHGVFVQRHNSVLFFNPKERT